MLPAMQRFPLLSGVWLSAKQHSWPDFASFWRKLALCVNFTRKSFLGSSRWALVVGQGTACHCSGIHVYVACQDCCCWVLGNLVYLDHSNQKCNRRARGVVVSHPLSMREALGSIPSVSMLPAMQRFPLLSGVWLSAKPHSWPDFASL